MTDAPRSKPAMTNKPEALPMTTIPGWPLWPLPASAVALCALLSRNDVLVGMVLGCAWTLWMFAAHAWWKVHVDRAASGSSNTSDDGR